MMKHSLLWILLLLFPLNTRAQSSQPKEKNEVVKLVYEYTGLDQPDAEGTSLPMPMDHKVDKRYYAVYYIQGEMLLEKLPESICTIDLGSEHILEYTDLKENRSSYETIFEGKPYLVSGKIPVPHWEMSGETFNIMGWNCQCAYYNGNKKISAWFTPEVPIAVSLDVFYGLPGLIVQINFYNTKYQLKEISTVAEMPKMRPAKGEKITLEDFNKMREDYIERSRAIDSGVQILGD